MNLKMPPTVQTNEPDREKRLQRTGERRLVYFIELTDLFRAAALNSRIYLADRS